MILYFSNFAYKKKPYVKGSLISLNLNLSKRLFKVGNQVINMLDTNGQANQVFTDPCRFKFLLIELAVGGGCWVAGQTFGIPNIHQTCK